MTGVRQSATRLLGAGRTFSQTLLVGQFRNFRLVIPRTPRVSKSYYAAQMQLVNLKYIFLPLGLLFLSKIFYLFFPRLPTSYF